MIWKGYEDTVILSGHRGVRFTAPENTMTAFHRAIDIGVDMIETDVHMTRDHELVLMHDHEVDRRTLRRARRPAGGQPDLHDGALHLVGREHRTVELDPQVDRHGLRLGLERGEEPAHGDSRGGEKAEK